MGPKDDTSSTGLGADGAPWWDFPSDAEELLKELALPCQSDKEDLVSRLRLLVGVHGYEYYSRVFDVLTRAEEGALVAALGRIE